MFKRELTRTPISKEVFNQTLMAFESMVDRDIVLVISDTVPCSSTDGKSVIVRGRYPELDIDYLSYYSYVTFQHELSHILARSSLTIFNNFVKTRRHTDLAKLSFNVIEDERCEVLYNLFYLTPFREYQGKFCRLMAQRRQTFDAIDVVFHVRSQIKMSADSEYLRLWDEIDNIFEIVRRGGRGNISLRSTVRAANILYTVLVRELNSGASYNKTTGGGDSDGDNDSDGDDDSNVNNSDSEGSGSTDTPADIAKEVIELLGGSSEESEHSEGDNQDGSEKGSCIGDHNYSGVTDDEAEKMASQADHDTTGEKQNNFTITERDELKHPQIEPVDDYNLVSTGSEDMDTEIFVSEIEKRLTKMDRVKTPEEEVGLVRGLVRHDKVLSGVRTLHVINPFAKRVRPYIDDEGEEIDVEEYVVRILTDNRDTPIYRGEVPEVGLRVCFLLDLSSSMGERDVRSMYTAATTIWRSLERMSADIDNKCFAVLYSTRGHMTKVSDPDQLLWYRGQGSTGTDTAIEYAVLLLLRERRRPYVIIHITDGIPDSQAETASALKFAEDNGVLVFTLFVGEEEVSKVFSKNTLRIPNRPSELIRAIEGILFPMIARELRL